MVTTPLHPFCQDPVVISSCSLWLESRPLNYAILKKDKFLVVSVAETISAFDREPN